MRSHVVNHFARHGSTFRHQSLAGLGAEACQVLVAQEGGQSHFLPRKVARGREGPHGGPPGRSEVENGKNLPSVWVYGLHTHLFGSAERIAAGWPLP